MKLIKIFGIGSPFGDDQAGWHVVEILRQEKTIAPYMPHCVQLAQLDRPGIRLLQQVHDTKIMILIDAVNSGATLGTLHQFENLTLENAKNILSTHGIGVIQTLQLGAVLNELPSQVILYGIEVGEIGYETFLSLPIKAASDKLAKLISEKVAMLVKN